MASCKNVLFFVIFVFIVSNFSFAENWALEFDGHYSEVIVPDNNSLDVSEVITLECWLNVYDLLYPWQALVTKSAAPSCRNYGLYLRSDGAIFLGYYNTLGSPVYLISAPRSIPLQEWVHLAGVIDYINQSMRIYLNGTLISETGISGRMQTNTVDLTIGKEYDNKWFFYGIIDEVRLSSNVRYLTNFTPRYRLDSDEYTLGLWHFNEGSGTTVFDSGPLFNDGTINNAEWIKGINDFYVDPKVFSIFLILEDKEQETDTLKIVNQGISGNFSILESSDFISLSTNSIYIPANSTGEVLVTFDCSSLVDSIYTSFIEVERESPMGGQLNIPVELKVYPSNAFSVSAIPDNINARRNQKNGFTVEISNNTRHQQNIDIWLSLVTPEGKNYTKKPMEIPYEVQLSPFYSIQSNIMLFIPGSAPLGGFYLLNVKVGNFKDNLVLAEDSFQFNIVP